MPLIKFPFRDQDRIINTDNILWSVMGQHSNGEKLTPRLTIRWSSKSADTTYDDDEAIEIFRRIDQHVAPEPAVIHQTMTGLEDLCRRVAVLEQLADMVDTDAEKADERIKAIAQRLADIEAEVFEARKVEEPTKESGSICDLQVKLAREAVEEWDGQDDNDLVLLLREKFGREIRGSDRITTSVKRPQCPRCRGIDIRKDGGKLFCRNCFEHFDPEPAAGHPDGSKDRRDVAGDHWHLRAKPMADGKPPIVVNLVTCPTCQGSGDDPCDLFNGCETCSGRGFAPPGEEPLPPGWKRTDCGVVEEYRNKSGGCVQKDGSMWHGFVTYKDRVGARAIREPDRLSVWMKYPSRSAAIEAVEAAFAHQADHAAATGEVG